MAQTEEILALYEYNEKAAIQMLFDTYYEPLLLYSYRIVQHREEAEDIVQEYFVSLWLSRRLSGFKGELRHFMFRAVRYRSLNRLRERNKRQAMYCDICEEKPAWDVPDKETEMGEIEFLYRTIDGLPVNCRKIFLMAALDGLKYGEIADLLHISVNTVKTQMKIAFRFLREHLRHYKIYCVNVNYGIQYEFRSFLFNSFAK